MKKRLGRELFWLSLPAVLLVGAAWYNRTDGALVESFLPNPLDRGPMRIEFSRFAPAPLSPLDVAQGFSWATQTRTRTVGILNVPTNWRDDGEGGTSSPFSLVYRQGNRWKQAARPKSGGSLYSYGGSASSNFGSVEIKANLSTIPRDAEEVRFHGQFRSLRLYRGPLPRGWTSPVSVLHAGLNHFFTLKSKPFDIPIKAKGDKWPQPQVSHQQKFDCIGGAWLHDQLGEEVLVRFRAKPDSGLISDFPCQVSDVRFFDATGRELKVFQDAKSTVGFMVQGPMRQWVSPDLPKDEEVVRLMQTDAQPRGGWGTVKRPISVTGTVSDGECWPTPFKVLFTPREGEVKYYGAQPDVSQR